MLTSLAAFSQCAVCKTTLASSANEESAKGLNGGIIYLAAMPLLFMGFIGYRVWKQQREL